MGDVERVRKALGFSQHLRCDLIEAAISLSIACHSASRFSQHLRCDLIEASCFAVVELR